MGSTAAVTVNGWMAGQLSGAQIIRLKSVAVIHSVDYQSAQDAGKIMAAMIWRTDGSYVETVIMIYYLII
jgi:hypothetical protein